MRRDTRWFMMPRLVGAFTFAYLALFAFERGLQWVAGVAVRPAPDTVLPSYAILLAFAALYGFGRVTMFHPGFNVRYQKWLETAPFHPRMRLPLGPVQLGARDVLVLAAVAGLAHYASYGSALVPLLIFGVGYLLPLLAPLTGKGWWTFALSVGFAGLFRAAPNLPVMAGLLVVMYAVARAGLKHSLPRPTGKKPDAPSTTGLGPTFEQLAPVPPPKPIPLPHAVAYAALAGWWAYCLCGSLASEMRRLDVVILTSLAGMLVAFIRFCLYAGGSDSPLSVSGRWVTGRWIVPGYDQIFVAPLIVFVAGAALPSALARVIPSAAAVCGVCAAVVLLLALTLPPTRARWLLTGHRHMARRGGGDAKMIRVTA